MSNTTLTPSVGALSLTTNLVRSSIVAALTLVSASPTVLYTASFTVPSGQVNLTGIGPSQGLVITPLIAGVSLSGVATSIGLGSAPDIQAGSVSLSGTVPALSVGTITPNSALISIGGQVPVIGIPNVTITPLSRVVNLVGNSLFIGDAFGGATASLLLVGAAPQLAFVLRLSPVGTATSVLHSDALGMNLSIVVPATNMSVTTTGQSPTIRPSSGTITINGNVPKVGGPAVISISSVAASLLGSVPGITYTVPSPPCAALVVGGVAPGLGFRYTIVPNPETLVLIGLAPPANLHNTVLVPSTVVLALSPASVSLSWNLLTLSGSEQLTGTAPISQVSSRITPSVGAISLTGVVSTLLPGSSILTGVGTLSINGITPITLYALVTQTGILTLSATPPVLDLTIKPQGAVTTLSSVAPTINGNVTTQIATGVAVLASITPRLGLTITPTRSPVNLAAGAVTLGLTIATGSGGSVFLSDAPSVAQSGLPLSLTGSVLFATSAPIIGLGFAPPVAVVRAQGVQPVVNSLTTLITSSGAVTLSSDVPSVNQTGVIVPAVASLTVTGITVVFQRTGFVSPPAAALVMNSDPPLSQQTTVGFITPPSGAVVMIGQPFYIMRYEPDLYYVVNSRGPAQHIVKSPG